MSENMGTAPRITIEQIDENIEGEYYFTARQGAMHAMAQGPWGVIPRKHSETLGLLTFCVLVLRNGFTVVGKSACASPENYNQEIGEKFAKADAKSQMWALLGFALRQKLHDESL